MEEKHRLFRERLLDELNYQGISKLDFAKKVGISINTLNMYLYRGSIPAADVAVKMAQALNTTAEYLVTGRDSSTPPSKSGVKSDWQKKELAHIISTLTEQQLESFLAIARAYKTGGGTNFPWVVKCHFSGGKNEKFGTTQTRWNLPEV